MRKIQASFQKIRAKETRAENPGESNLSPGGRITPEGIVEAIDLLHKNISDQRKHIHKLEEYLAAWGLKS